MDAKPQRPARARTFRDENALSLEPPQGKTVHSRNKSSPALSALAATQGMKLGPRRTAFADVSNTSKPLHTAKDDSALSHKPAIASLKDSAAPFQKPAQRPLSVSSIKGFFNNIGANGISKQPVVYEQEEVEQKPPTQPVHKTLSRKATTVFKDISTQPEPPTLPEQTICLAAHPMLKKKSSIYVDAVETARPESQDRLPVIPAVGSGSCSSEYYDVRSDGVPLPADTELPVSAPDSPAESPVDADANIMSFPDTLRPEPIKPAAIRPGDILSTEAQYHRDRYSQGQGQGQSQGVSLRDHVSERWIDEPYVEYEEDYTTARSLKSRSETTTGPTTIVLAPKPTADADEEISAAKRHVEESPAVIELEEDEQWDTSMVAEYSEEIFSYMRSLEETMRPNPYYMDNQTEVQWSMRSVLMDWLVQVHLRFQLLPETLFLCVNYVDRFLSSKVVSLAKLQLVGATAIFVAAKYEEINCPSVQEIVYMVDGGYTIEEILKAERFMLSMLNFELGWPGPMSFLRRISKADDYDLETRTLAKYFLEITIMDERFVGCIPSYTAAGAHCIARLMLKKGPWSLKHVHYSSYTYAQLRPLLAAILSCCEDAQKHHAAVYDKYGDRRFKRASFYVQTEMDSGFTLPPAYQTHLITPISEPGDKW